MRYPINISESGFFQELAHSSKIKFGQLSMLTINPKCTRGGHYHTRKTEWFCCIHGECKIEITDIRDETIFSFRTILLSGDFRESALVKPHEVHTITNLSNIKTCELLVIASEEYDPKDPDTFRTQGQSKRCETHGVEECLACGMGAKQWD